MRRASDHHSSNLSPVREHHLAEEQRKAKQTTREGLQTFGVVLRQGAGMSRKDAKVREMTRGKMVVRHHLAATPESSDCSIRPGPTLLREKTGDAEMRMTSARLLLDAIPLACQPASPTAAAVIYSWTAGSIRASSD